MSIAKSAVAFVAALAFAAGCQAGSSTRNPRPDGTAAPPAVQPIDAVKAATTKLGTTTYTFTTKIDQASVTGSVDPAVKSVKSAVSTSSMTTDALIVDSDFYLRVSGLQLPGLDATKWLHLDEKKIKSLAAFGISDLIDPLGLAVISAGITSVTQTGDRTYRGTFDLTRPAAGITDADIKALADKAKNIPFEATLDAEGRFSTLKFTVPARGNQPAKTFDIAISGYGAKVDVAKPPANQVVEAPEIVYQLINAL